MHLVCEKEAFNTRASCDNLIYGVSFLLSFSIAEMSLRQQNNSLMFPRKEPVKATRNYSTV